MALAEKVILTAAVPAETVAELKRLAADGDRSLSAEVRRAIAEHLAVSASRGRRMKLPTLRMGTIAAPKPAPPADKELRDARVNAARRYWHETPAERLVSRGRWLVDAETDLVYRPFRGATFERGAARLIADGQELSFYLDGDGSPVALECLPRTWSEMFDRRLRRGAA
jgi:hypothetical protein